MIRTPLAVNTAIGLGRELRLPVPNQELQAASAALEIHQQVTGVPGHLRAGRVGGDPGQVPAAGAVPEEEQHVQTAQDHGAGVAEVRGEDRGGLPGQDRAPGLPGPPGCGIEAGVLEDLPHRRRREFVPQASCWYATLTEFRIAGTSRLRKASRRRLGTTSRVRFPAETFNTMSASGFVYASLRQCVKTLVFVFEVLDSATSYAGAPMALACSLSILGWTRVLVGLFGNTTLPRTRMPVVVFGIERHASEITTTCGMPLSRASSMVSTQLTASSALPGASESSHSSALFFQ
jgi:hypothetical protein